MENERSVGSDQAQAMVATFKVTNHIDRGAVEQVDKALRLGVPRRLIVIQPPGLENLEVAALPFLNTEGENDLW